MDDIRLVLSIPQGITTATSLGIEGLAKHHSPGSGKHFKGRKLFVDLAVKDQQPDFKYLDDGGWRDALALHCRWTRLCVAIHCNLVSSSQ